MYGRTPGFDIIGGVICLKTWSDVCHIEIHVGNGMSVASRNGLGVNLYPLRKGQLVHVLRPHYKPDLDLGMKWFREVAQGQPYDWRGLLNFGAYGLTGKDIKSRGMFCSEFADRFDRKCKLYSFAVHFDANCVAPADYLMSAAFRLTWSKGEIRKLG